jgi:hypothetical protein
MKRASKQTAVYIIGSFTGQEKPEIDSTNQSTTSGKHKRGACVVRASE